ncbi:hypothetical protein HKCCE2091_15035 [Rhodobacterales bacterium HKCCE2091]|nr:hypothetical protein [Rhodobacterales bacterium HKCCE2091]
MNTPEDWRDLETARANFRIVWCDALGIAHSACGPASEWTTPSDHVASALHIARLEHCRRAFAGTGDEPDDINDNCGALFAGYEASFVHAWNIEWQAQLRRLATRDLSGADLRGANLVGAQMQGAILAGALMQGASLQWAQMEAADLSGALMQGRT